MSCASFCSSSIKNMELLQKMTLRLLVLFIIFGLSSSQWMSYPRSPGSEKLWMPNMPSPKGPNPGNHFSPTPSTTLQTPKVKTSDQTLRQRSISVNNNYQSNNHPSRGMNGNNINGLVPPPLPRGLPPQQQTQQHYPQRGFNNGKIPLPPQPVPLQQQRSSGNIQNTMLAASRRNTNPQFQNIGSPQQQQSSHFSMNRGNGNQGHQNSNQVINNLRNGANRAIHTGPTARPVSQQPGQLHDSWPNSNTHHHLAPPGYQAPLRPSPSSQKNDAPSKVRLSNQPLQFTPSESQQRPELTKTDLDKSPLSAQQKEKLLQMTNTLTKLSPKKPINVFMRQEGLAAVRAGADAGDVIKKFAGSSKVPFFNGTLPQGNTPSVFLAPEDMPTPYGYGKMQIPTLKKDDSKVHGQEDYLPMSSSPSMQVVKSEGQQLRGWHDNNQRGQGQHQGGNSRSSQYFPPSSTSNPFLGPATMRPPPGYTKVLLPQGASGGPLAQQQYNPLSNTKTLNALSVDQKLKILNLLKSGRTQVFGQNGQNMNPGQQSMSGNDIKYQTSYKIVHAPPSINGSKTDPYTFLKGVLPEGAIVESISPFGGDSTASASINTPIQSSKPLSQNLQGFGGEGNKPHVVNPPQQISMQQQTNRQQQHNNQQPLSPINYQQLHQMNQQNQHMNQQQNGPQQPNTQSVHPKVVVNPGIQISMPKVTDGGLNENELKKLIGAIVKGDNTKSYSSPPPPSPTPQPQASLPQQPQGPVQQGPPPGWNQVPIKNQSPQGPFTHQSQSFGSQQPFPPNNNPVNHGNPQFTQQMPFVQPINLQIPPNNLQNFGPQGPHGSLHLKQPQTIVYPQGQAQQFQPQVIGFQQHQLQRQTIVYPQRHPEPDGAHGNPVATPLQVFPQGFQPGQPQGPAIQPVQPERLPVQVFSEVVNPPELQQKKQRLPVLIPAPPPTPPTTRPPKPKTPKTTTMTTTTSSKPIPTLPIPIPVHEEPPTFKHEQHPHPQIKDRGTSQGKSRNPLQTALSLLGIQSALKPELIIGKPIPKFPKRVRPNIRKKPLPSTTPVEQSSNQIEEDDSTSSESSQHEEMSDPRRPTLIFRPSSNSRVDTDTMDHERQKPPTIVITGGDGSNLPDINKIISSLTNIHDSDEEFPQHSQNRPRLPHPTFKPHFPSSTPHNIFHHPNRHPTMGPFSQSRQPNLHPQTIFKSQGLPGPTQVPIILSATGRPAPVIQQSTARPLTFVSSTPSYHQHSPVPIHGSTAASYLFTNQSPGPILLQTKNPTTQFVSLPPPTQEPQPPPIQPQQFLMQSATGAPLLVTIGGGAASLHASAIQNIVRQSLGPQVPPVGASSGAPFIINPTGASFFGPTPALVPVGINPFRQIFPNTNLEGSQQPPISLPSIEPIITTTGDPAWSPLKNESSEEILSKEKYPKESSQSSKEGYYRNRLQNPSNKEHERPNPSNKERERQNPSSREKERTHSSSFERSRPKANNQRENLTPSNWESDSNNFKDRDSENTNNKGRDSNNNFRDDSHGNNNNDRDSNSYFRDRDSQNNNDRNSNNNFRDRDSQNNNDRNSNNNNFRDRDTDISNFRNRDTDINNFRERDTDISIFRDRDTNSNFRDRDFQNNNEKTRESNNNFKDRNLHSNNDKDLNSFKEREVQNTNDQVIEKVRTEEKIVWNGSIPSKIRTEERTIIRPHGPSSSLSTSHSSHMSKSDKETSGAESVLSEEVIRPNPVHQVSFEDQLKPEYKPPSSIYDQNQQYLDNFFHSSTPAYDDSENIRQKSNINSHPSDINRHQGQNHYHNKKTASKEDFPEAKPSSSFSDLLTSKLKFEQMKEQLYPHQNLNGPHAENTSSQSQLFAYNNPDYFSVKPTVLITTTTTSEAPTTDLDVNGRFRIRPGDLAKYEDMTPVHSITPSTLDHSMMAHIEMHKHKPMAFVVSSSTQPPGIVSSSPTADYFSAPELSYYPVQEGSLQQSVQYSPAGGSEHKQMQPPPPGFQSISTMVGPIGSEEKLLFLPSSSKTGYSEGSNTQERLLFLPSSTQNTRNDQSTIYYSDGKGLQNKISEDIHLINDTPIWDPLDKESNEETRIKPTSTTTTTPTPSSTPPSTTTAIPTIITSTTKPTTKSTTESSEVKPITWRPTKLPTITTQRVPQPVVFISSAARAKAAGVGAGTMLAMMAGLPHQPKHYWQDTSHMAHKDLGASVLYAMANGSPMPIVSTSPPMVPLVPPMYQHPPFHHPMMLHPQMIPVQGPMITHPQMPPMTFYNPSQSPLYELSSTEAPTMNQYYDESWKWNGQEEQELNEPIPEAPSTRPPLEGKPRYRNKYRVPVDSGTSDPDNLKKLIPVYVHKGSRRNRYRTKSTSTTTPMPEQEQPSTEYDDEIMRVEESIAGNSEKKTLSREEKQTKSQESMRNRQPGIDDSTNRNSRDKIRRLNQRVPISHQFQQKPHMKDSAFAPEDIDVDGQEQQEIEELPNIYSSKIRSNEERLQRPLKRPLVDQPVFKGKIESHLSRDHTEEDAFYDILEDIPLPKSRKRIRPEAVKTTSTSLPILKDTSEAEKDSSEEVREKISTSVMTPPEKKKMNKFSSGSDEIYDDYDFKPMFNVNFKLGAKRVSPTEQPTAPALPRRRGNRRRTTSSSTTISASPEDESEEEEEELPKEISTVKPRRKSTTERNNVLVKSFPKFKSKSSEHRDTVSGESSSRSREATDYHTEEKSSSKSKNSSDGFPAPNQFSHRTPTLATIGNVEQNYVHPTYEIKSEDFQTNYENSYQYSKQPASTIPGNYQTNSGQYSIGEQEEQVPTDKKKELGIDNEGHSQPQSEKSITEKPFQVDTQDLVTQQNSNTREQEIFTLNTENNFNGFQYNRQHNMQPSQFQNQNQYMELPQGPSHPQMYQNIQQSAPYQTQFGPVQGSFGLPQYHPNNGFQPIIPMVQPNYYGTIPDNFGMPKGNNNNEFQYKQQPQVQFTSPFITELTGLLQNARNSFVQQPYPNPPTSFSNVLQQIGIQGKQQSEEKIQNENGQTETSRMQFQGEQNEIPTAQTGLLHTLFPEEKTALNLQIQSNSSDVGNHQSEIQVVPTRKVSSIRVDPEIAASEIERIQVFPDFGRKSVSREVLKPGYISTSVNAEPKTSVSEVRESQDFPSKFKKSSESIEVSKTGYVSLTGEQERSASENRRSQPFSSKFRKTESRELPKQSYVSKDMFMVSGEDKDQNDRKVDLISEEEKDPFRLAAVGVLKNDLGMSLISTAAKDTPYIIKSGSVVKHSGSNFGFTDEDVITYTNPAVTVSTTSAATPALTTTASTSTTTITPKPETTQTTTAIVQITTPTTIEPKQHEASDYEDGDWKQLLKKLADRLLMDESDNIYDYYDQGDIVEPIPKLTTTRKPTKSKSKNEKSNKNKDNYKNKNTQAHSSHTTRRPTRVITTKKPVTIKTTTPRSSKLKFKTTKVPASAKPTTRVTKITTVTQGTTSKANVTTTPTTQPATTKSTSTEATTTRTAATTTSTEPSTSITTPSPTTAVTLEITLPPVPSTASTSIEINTPVHQTFDSSYHNFGSSPKFGMYPNPGQYSNFGSEYSGSVQYPNYGQYQNSGPLYPNPVHYSNPGPDFTRNPGSLNPVSYIPPYPKFDASVEPSGEIYSKPGKISQHQRPFWVRRKINGTVIDEPLPVPGATAQAQTRPEYRKIRLVRKRRPGIHSLDPNSRLASSGSFEQETSIDRSEWSPVLPSVASSTTVLPIEKMFVPDIEKRVGDTDLFKSPLYQDTLIIPGKKMLKLIRKGNQAHWKLKLNEETPFQDDALPQVQHLVSPRVTTSFTSSESYKPQKTVRMESSVDVETRVCVRGKCKIVTKN